MTETFLTRGEQTRQAIIQSAHQLFIQQGYHGTSMRQIASQASIALGGLYNHFPSKEDVFRAVFFAYHPYHEILPLLLNAQGDSVEPFIRNAASQVLHILRNRPDFFNLTFIELVEFEGRHLGELFSQVMPLGIQIAERIKEMGKDQLRPISPQLLVRTILGLFISYFLTERIMSPLGQSEFDDQDMQTFIHIYLHGVIKSEAAEA